MNRLKLQAREICAGLGFPEGPIAMPDGSIVLVEIVGNLIRVSQDGRRQVVAELGGGPNGAAVGPDGMVYVCDNGGFDWHRDESGNLRAAGRARDYTGGSIQRVDLDTGHADTLYSHCDGEPLKGPNDLVFDTDGEFWFTDFGKIYGRLMDRGAIYYAKADGSSITEVAFPLITPNGIGLSPDGRTLFVAETESARLWAYPITGPGVVAKAPWPSPAGGEFVAAFNGGFGRFDSLAVEANGNICVGTLVAGGITVVSPAGELLEFHETPDPVCTNICFGGKDLRTAYITLSGTGTVIAADWPRPGLRLAY